jgi:hypothetical protein
MLLEPLFISILTPYVLLTAGLGTGLYLFYTLKVEIARISAKSREQSSALKAALQASEAERANLRRDLDRLVARIGTSGPVRVTAGDVSRDRILRLHEQGESPTAIAQTLGLPDGKVQLLLKVRRMMGATS